MKLFPRLFFVAGLLATVAAGGYALAQNTGQVLATLLGSELIQLTSPTNTTAAITYTTTANIRDGRDYVYNVPLTGATISLAVVKSALSLNPAGTIAALTVNLPPTTFDGKIVSIFTTQTITALTLATTNGATINTPVTTLAANATVAYVYDLATTTWYRIQ
jgi:hypothetical protein